MVVLAALACAPVTFRARPACYRFSEALVPFLMGCTY
jgi:hypothetical protein